jgi:hypothetical protein
MLKYNITICFINFVSVKLSKNYIIGTWFLILLLVFAIIPKDIIHEFHDHEQEIEHIELNCHNHHFESKHNHCPILNQVIPIFYLAAQIQQESSFVTIFQLKIQSKIFLKTPTHFLFGLKAPPIQCKNIC